jgi:Phage integrase, N-terminal SAM-like domain
MSEKPISPLRQRMLEDMNMRRFVPDTQREYIRAVKRLAIFLGRSPDTATAEELRAFQLHLTEALRRWTPGASPICASRSHGKPCGMPLREYWRNRRGAPSG